MADDVNANIRIDIDTSDALASLRALQSQISTFNKSIIQSNASAVAAQKSMTATLLAQIGATKQFSTSMVNVETSTARLGRAIDKNRLSLGEYFRYGAASSKTFGRVFTKEHTAIMDLAADRVKRLQTQYIAMGEAQNGVTRAMAVRPMHLFNADAAIATQRQQLFNKLLNDGSTRLINFGKNTQWAGRQLMVGFTVPLTIFGGMAGQVFMDLERQVVNFRRVYGDAMTPAGETDQMVEEIQNLAKEFTKYGIAVKDTVGLAGDVAAAGAQGADLIAATAQSTRLATLGMIEMDQAMTATMALQTAFRLSNEELAQSVDFLNAVENQTVLSLDDVTEAIPRVAPVIKGLGGDVQDLAIFLTAMREGGVSAAEGANALKSGLASLINPTKAAKEQLKAVGININAILSQNKGDIRAIVTEFGAALGTLDKFQRQQTLAKVFGKYQFARLGALFENISRDGSQAQRVVDLTGQSFEELGDLAEKELAAIEESIGMKFTGAVERLKLAIAPIGEVFLKIATPIIDVVTNLLEKFNELSPGVKQFISVLVAGVGVVVPTVIMLIGLFGNFIGQAIKGFAMFNNFFNRLRGGGSDLTYLAEQELDAAAAAASLEGKTESLTSALNIQRTAVGQLARAYDTYVSSARIAATNLPQGFGRPPRTMAAGGIVGGTGNKDTEPALLTPGEFVMNRQATEKFAPVLDAMNRGQITELNDGSRLARTPFGEFQTQRTNSVAGVVSLLSQLVNLSETDTQRVTEGLRALEQQNKLNRSSTEQLIKQLGVMPQRLSTAMVDAHVFTQSQQSITAAEARRLATASGSPITAPESLRKLDVLEQLEASVPGSTRILQRSDFVVGLPKEINNALKDGLSSGAFADAFETSGVEKWGKVIKMSGANAQDAIPEFSLLDAKVIELSRNAELAGLKIGDVADETQGIISFGDITKQAMDELESSGHSMGIVRQAVEDLEGRFRTFQVGINSELIPALREAGYAIQEISRVSASGRVERGYEVSGKGISPTFIRGQSQREKAPGAYGNVSSSAYSLGDVAITGINTATGSASESKRAQQAAQDVVDGFANELRRGIPDAQSSAQGLGDAAVKSLSGSTSDIRKILKEQLGVGPIVEEEQRQLKETIALRKEENREILRRARLLGRQGYGPEVAKRLAREQLAAERTAVVPPNARMLPIVPPTAQPVVPEGAKILPIVSSQLVEETRGTTREMSKVRNAASKMGGMLKNGSMKMQGMLFGLDGLVFGLSFMENSVGEFAQKIMPAVFGIQALTMVLPMATKGISMLAATGPVGIIVAAMVAAAAGIYAMKKVADDTAARGKELGEAMYGTSQAMKDTASFFGRKTFGQKLGEMKIQAAGVDVATPEQATEAQGYLESEVGKKLISDIQLAMETGGTKLATTSLQNQLKSMLLSGSIAPDMAIAVAQELSKQLGSTQMAIDVSGNLRTMVGPDGEKLRFEEGRISIIADIIADTNMFEEAMNQAGLIWDGSSWFSQLSMIVTGAGTADIAAENIGAQVAGQQRVISEEMDRLELRFRKGKMSVEEYTSAIGALNDQSLKIDYASVLEESIRTIPGFDASAADRLGQSLVDSLRQSLNFSSLGVDGATEFVEGFTRTVDLKVGDMVLPTDVNMFDPEAVRIAVENLRKQGEDALADSLQADFNAIMNLSLKVQSGEISVDTISKLIEGGLKPEEIALELNFTFDDPRIENNFNALLRMVDGKSQLAQFLIEAKSDPNALNFMNNALPMILEAAQKGINIEAIFDMKGKGLAAKGIKDVLDKINAFDSIKTPITKKRILSFLKEEDPDFWSAINNFEGLDNAQIKEFISLYRTIIADPERMSAEAAKRKAAVTGGEGSDRRFFNLPGAPSEENLAGQQLIAEILGDGEKKNNGDVPTTEKPTGGGGGGSESWLQGLIKEIGATLQLLPKEINKLKKLVPDMPQQFIDLIGFGEEGLKRIGELLGLKGKDLKNLVNKWVKKTTSEINQGIQGEIATGRQKQQAFSILTEQGFSPEEAEKIASNGEYALLVISAAAGKTKKSLDGVVQGFRDLEDASEINPNQSAIDQLNDQIDLEKRAFDVAIDRVDDLIEAQQDRIDSIQDEIDAIEELNEADQRLLRDKDRQIEAYNRQIDGVERLIEKEQDSIDKLKEEDDLRNRRSAALSHDLEMLSQAEDDIRNAYQQRIDALEKVATVNDRILQQQKDQLNVSQALASGDIYEATRAAREMQQNDVAFAQTQAREALTAGMENEIAGLRTAGGLTREEAEKEIANIKEQSYQTSLLIQGIEDTILTKNKEIEGIKRMIRDVEDEKLVIEDRIYDRETLILDIQTKRLEPAQKQYEKLVDQKDEMKKIFDTKIATMEKEVEELELGNERINQINNLAAAWGEVGNAIAAANKVLKDGETKLGRAPVRIATESYDDWQARLNKWFADKAALEATYNSSIGSAYATGMSASASVGMSNPSPYAIGGMGIQFRNAGGMIKGYKNGGVAGVDSVPAMLTPGEFVVRKAMVDKYGVPMFESLNQGSFAMPRYDTQSSATGNVKVNNQNTSNIVAPMYNNYSVNVSVSNANASADEIANRTIQKIKQMSDMQIRSGRGY